MRDVDKVLICFLTHVRFLLPSIIFPNYQCSYPMSHQIVNDPSACCVHVMVDTTVALRGYALHAFCSTRMTELFLKFCFAFIVKLVDGLHWTPVNQNRYKTGKV